MSTKTDHARSKRLPQTDGETPNLAQQNLVFALRQGLIDWFKFFELWKATDETA